MNTALVAGGAGFIGSHVVDALIMRGLNVVVMDDLSSGLKENILNKDVVFINGDIRDAELVNHTFEVHKPDFVFHLAAQISVSRSVREPQYDADINIMGLLNLLEASVKNGTKKFIFSSSGGVMYGENPSVYPTPETEPERPFSPYGISKLAGERYLYFYKKEYGLDYTILRYANVYGPRQNPLGEAGVVAIFTEGMLKKQALTINGDGKYIRDYVYVEDIANANMLAMDNGKDVAYNIGTGIAVDVNELFERMKQVNGYEMEPTHGPERPGDLRKSILNSTLAEQELNWKPQYTLEQGLIQTHEFFESKLGL
ncbi:MAG TPA: GDP-mannose 4,6-dehydratase [Thermotogota bacterium]|nr:GDP-mannose 4,6-dehydratase [Thermotogota bacterium]HPJ89441.1 GDP-mannose 4,6-dehydratase [Thermotogota bacterium]HPR95266.1 GDP-mannose 4,6-dehydratase [Thermotogota bacterium]